jgi:hypothetical protein
LPVERRKKEAPRQQALHLWLQGVVGDANIHMQLITRVACANTLFSSGRVVMTTPLGTRIIMHISKATIHAQSPDSKTLTPVLQPTQKTKIIQVRLPLRKVPLKLDGGFGCRRSLGRTVIHR